LNHLDDAGIGRLDGIYVVLCQRPVQVCAIVLPAADLPLSGHRSDAEDPLSRDSSRPVAG
jgi:hypothetical protein